MSQRTRILIAVAVIVVLVGAVVGVDQIQRRAAAQSELPPGAIPIALDGQVIGGFLPDDLGQLEEVSFVDDEDGKTQQGWLLRDVLLLYLDRDTLSPDTVITVSSSSREKTIDVTWAEADEADNMVMFDLAGRGTLKLVSRGLEQLDVRDEWVQDVDSISIATR